jgi:acyl-coenzyme A synthetase/AMP-(fatty) acid ligase
MSLNLALLRQVEFREGLPKGPTGKILERELQG